ncbi:MAG: lysylphosphatidylglycerol synthase transmembrane domain-containing protein [Jatrophihabitans sp.]
MRLPACVEASNAISISASAGPAVSNVYLYRQLRRVGANTAAVTWTLLAGTVVSGLAFSTITIAGTLLSGSTTLAEIVGASVLSLTTGALLVGGLATITKHPAPLVRIVGASMARLPRRWTHRDAGATPESSKHRVVEQLAAIQPRVRDWSTALALSILSWTADLACFVLCLYAVGADGVVLSVAVLAYVAGLATIGLSVTPGGLGGVEAGMLIVLTHGGVANPLTLAGIVIYRLVAYRLVAYLLFGAVGWLAWLDVHRRQPSRIEGCAGCDDIPDALTVP